MYCQILSILVAANLVVCQLSVLPRSNKISRKVKLDVYYESLCSDSIRLYTKELVNVMKELGTYIDLKTYPYGKASTHEHNGDITFECQHGAKECYGNKLHACAIDQLQYPSWLQYNACLMTGRSDDAAADVCAKKLETNSDPIKMCAQGDKGTQLLKYYGEQSKLVSYNYIPHVVINGTPMPDHADLNKTVSDVINNQTV